MDPSPTNTWGYLRKVVGTTGLEVILGSVTSVPFCVCVTSWIPMYSASAWLAGRGSMGTSLLRLRILWGVERADASLARLALSSKDDVASKFAGVTRVDVTVFVEDFGLWYKVSSSWGDLNESMGMAGMGVFLVLVTADPFGVCVPRWAPTYSASDLLTPSFGIVSSTVAAVNENGGDSLPLMMGTTRVWRGF